MMASLSYYGNRSYYTRAAPPPRPPDEEEDQQPLLLSEQSPLVLWNVPRSTRKSRGEGQEQTNPRWKLGLTFLLVVLCLLGCAFYRPDVATHKETSESQSGLSSLDPMTEEDPMLPPRLLDPSFAHHLDGRASAATIPYEFWEAWKEQDLLKIAKQHTSSSSSSSSRTHTPPPPSDSDSADGIPSSNSASPELDWLHQTWNASAETARDVWNRIHQESGDAEHAVGNWWSRSEQHTEQWWNNTQGTTKQWWNRTVGSEQEWQDTTSSQLHVLGTRLRSWWNTTAAITQSKEHVLQHNFVSWWKRAGETERRWWNDTVEAFGRFEHRSADKSAAWWNWTRSTASDNWQTGVETEEEWWNATQIWFVNHTHRSNPGPYYYGDGRDLLYFNATRAFQMLTTPYGWFDQSSHFFYLQQGWDAQINQAYCGVASAMAVLNSFKGVLQSDLPIDPSYDPYHFATQQALVRHKCTAQHVVHVDDALDGILSFPGGLSLDQVGRLLECFLLPTWNVSVVHVTPSLSLDEVSRDVVGALHDPASRVLVNFHRQALGQVGGGHFSPLGAYHVPERKILLMDVAKYKYPPVWVPLEQLYLSMQTLDRCGSHTFPTPHRQNALLVNITQAYRSNASQHRLEKLMQQASDLLECQPSYRGYIIVRQGL